MGYAYALWRDPVFTLDQARDILVQGEQEK